MSEEEGEKIEKMCVLLSDAEYYYIEQLEKLDVDTDLDKIYKIGKKLNNINKTLRTYCEYSDE